MDETAPLGWLKRDGLALGDMCHRNDVANSAAHIAVGTLDRWFPSESCDDVDGLVAAGAAESHLILLTDEERLARWMRRSVQILQRKPDANLTEIAARISVAASVRGQGQA
jgi:hypothetical protein